MYLTRIEPDANRFRYYRIEIVRGLFGDWGLVRSVRGWLTAVNQFAIMFEDRFSPTGG